jgi:hypothetical protein
MLLSDLEEQTDAAYDCLERHDNIESARLAFLIDCGERYMATYAGDPMPTLEAYMSTAQDVFDEVLAMTKSKDKS